ncbi:MAG: hypothetical protein DRN59_03450 [Thaumarchaeota archaeon]|nr:MAG: hypothetical protein DRN59_03450 [Nitrososphaerota archaeon]
MNEIARRVGDVLTALTLLKFAKIKGLTVDEDEEKLRKRILAVKPVLQNLLREIESTIKSGYGPPPLIRALQEEYGYADLKKVREKLRNAINALERMDRGDYREEDFEELERLLECIAYEASSRSRELIAKAGRY